MNVELDENLEIFAEKIAILDLLFSDKLCEKKYFNNDSSFLLFAFF
jgi:hypothetical protein